MELDGLANTDHVRDLDGTGIIGPHHVAHQEVAALERALVLVDHPADVQAILNSPLIVAGKLLKHVPERLQRGAAAQLADDVRVGLGHDNVWPTGRQPWLTTVAIDSEPPSNIATAPSGNAL